MVKTGSEPKKVPLQPTHVKGYMTNYLLIYEWKQKGWTRAV